MDGLYVENLSGARPQRRARVDGVDGPGMLHLTRRIRPIRRDGMTRLVSPRLVDWRPPHVDVFSGQPMATEARDAGVQFRTSATVRST